MIKAPSNASISDSLIVDYINRFYSVDVSARMELFDLKTTYQFQTQPGVDRYNMPLYYPQVEPGGQDISPIPVYQGFMDPIYVQGYKVPFYTQRDLFFNTWSNYVQTLIATAVGDGTTGPYTIQLPFINNPPVQNNPQFCIRGHVDLTGIISLGAPFQDPPVPALIDIDTSIATVPVTSVSSAVFITSTDATGANVVVQDSGQFLFGNINYGLMMSQGKAPTGNTPLPGGYSTTSNTVNYASGVVNVTFPVAIPVGQNINAQCYYYTLGRPYSLLFYNNCITLRAPPDTQYLMQLDAYLTPAAFLTTTAAIPFGYMTEYLALGAARKMLSDTGDAEQLAFYEPRFREQESLVHIRSQRQRTATRTPTIYSLGKSPNWGGGSNMGQSGGL